MKRVLTAVVLIPLVLFLVFLDRSGSGYSRWRRRVAAIAGWEYMGWRRGRLQTAAGCGAGGSPGLVCATINGGPPGHLRILSLALLVYCTFFKPVEQVMSTLRIVFCWFISGSR